MHVVEFFGSYVEGERIVASTLAQQKLQNTNSARKSRNLQARTSASARSGVDVARAAACARTASSSAAPGAGRAPVALDERTETSRAGGHVTCADRSMRTRLRSQRVRARVRARGQRGGPADWLSDPMLEEALRALQAPRIWGGMNASAAAACEAQGAATYVAQKLGGFERMRAALQLAGAADKGQRQIVADLERRAHR